MSGKHTPETCEYCAADTGDHPLGGVMQSLKCGCSVHGRGLLPDPWHIHQCPLHASAAKLLAALEYLFSNAEAAGWSDMMLADVRTAIRKARGEDT